MTDVDLAPQHYADPADLRRKLEERASQWYVFDRVRSKPGGQTP